jgi:integrase
MRTNKTFGVQFIIRTNKAKNGKAPLYARISVDGRRLELSLRKFIYPDNWNEVKGIAKARNDEMRALNNHLEQVRSRLTECYQELTLKKKLVTADAVKNLFCGVEEEAHSLMSMFDYHNSEMKNVLEWGTLKNYNATKNYFQLYLKEALHTSDIYLPDLNYRFLGGFQKFMREHEPLLPKKPCGQNTVMKHIERLRKIVNLAIKNEWLERDPFMKFQSSFIRKERLFLTADELAAIEARDYSIVRLQHAKDMFVFSCYTGLSYIDAFNLTSQNLNIGIDGAYWITTCRKKTDQPVRIPLLPKALEIIEKYKNHPYVISRGKLLPVYSNQKTNAYLKEIADLCGIEKPLTFHIARHTFATTVTLTNGVPIETVSKLLGHTSIRTTQIYAKVIEKKVSDDMRNLRDILACKKDERDSKSKTLSKSV